MANEFRETSTLLTGLRDSQIPGDKTTLLVPETGTTRPKSLASTKSILRHVSGLIQYYLDAWSETSVTLTGESPLVLVHDYLESVAERGRTAPSAGKHALAVWPEALGICRPLTNPLVLSAAIVDSNEEPKQAPSIELDTAKAIEHIALNEEVCVHKRAFAAGILLMTYASLRFADVQRLRPFGVNEDSIRGTLLSSKTKKSHGQNWPWACPLMGLTGATDWIQPIAQLRAAYRKVNGRDMSYTFPRLGRKWLLVAEGPAPYSTTRRKLEILRTGLGGPNGESYTLHPQKNLSPTASNQMSFDQREMALIGHWSSASRMPERYGRSVCTI